MFTIDQMQYNFVQVFSGWFFSFIETIIMYSI